MSDVTFGVKVPEELKEQISKLMSNSGLTGKDFMQQIINTYTVEKTKESIPQVAEDLKELQTLTQRINNIYLNLGYRIENITKAQQEQIHKDLERKDSIITDLQTKIEILKEENDTLNNNYNESVNNNIQLNQRVNELTEINNNIKALIEEYKGKNDMLLSQLKQFEKYPEQLDVAKELLADAQTRELNMKNDLDIKNRELESLKNAVATINKDKEKSLSEINNKHIAELEVVKEKLELQKDKALLELKTQQQQQLEEVQNKHNAEIEQYQLKYKQLLEELEKSKKTSSTTHNKKAIPAQQKSDSKNTRA